MSWKLKSYKQKDAGTYAGVLKFVGEAKADIWDSVKREYKKDEFKDVIRFTFEFEDGTEGNKDCNPSSSSKSDLVKMLMSMNPKEWSEAIRVNDKTMERFAQALVGRSFLVNYAPNEYGKVKIQTAFPAPSVVSKVTKQAEPTPADDDDIPF